MAAQLIGVETNILTVFIYKGIAWPAAFVTSMTNTWARCEQAIVTINIYSDIILLTFILVITITIFIQASKHSRCSDIGELYVDVAGLAGSQRASAKYRAVTASFLECYDLVVTHGHTARSKTIIYSRAELQITDSYINIALAFFFYAFAIGTVSTSRTD
jgi:hypothetical protein